MRKKNINYSCAFQHVSPRYSVIFLFCSSPELKVILQLYCMLVNVICGVTNYKILLEIREICYLDGNMHTNDETVSVGSIYKLERQVLALKCVCM